jgi:Domain of unknown function (DUF4330)
MRVLDPFWKELNKPLPFFFLPFPSYLFLLPSTCWLQSITLLCLGKIFMAILDSKGRLFGKLNLLDFGAAMVILLVIIGVFFFPGTTGSVAQVGATSVPIEVDLVVRGLNVRDIKQMEEQGFKKGGKTKVIIRNQPYGEIGIKDVKSLSRTLMVPQPDGSVKELPDTRKNSFSTDLLLTLEGKAQKTEDGFVLGNNKVKIGIPLELDGFNYNFNATTIDVRMAEKQK